MTPEQRAAAERVRRVLAGEDGVKVYGCADWLTFFRAEKGMCLRAYLAEHPADDDEPVTLDRLEELFHDSRCNVVQRGLRFFVRFSGSVEVESVGEARRLLAALEGK